MCDDRIEETVRVRLPGSWWCRRHPYYINNLAKKQAGSASTDITNNPFCDGFVKGDIGCLLSSMELSGWVFIRSEW